MVDRTNHLFTLKSTSLYGRNVQISKKKVENYSYSWQSSSCLSFSLLFFQTDDSQTKWIYFSVYIKQNLLLKWRQIRRSKEQIFSEATAYDGQTTHSMKRVNSTQLNCFSILLGLSLSKLFEITILEPLKCNAILLNLQTICEKQLFFCWSNFLWDQYNLFLRNFVVISLIGLGRFRKESRLTPRTTVMTA